ncbi:MAG: hypothetical protein ACREL4_09315 [Gemmatimonadales bacterium]
MAAPAPDPARIFLPRFERAGVRYLVTGGVGAIIYGEPRMTNDIDVVVALPAADVRRFLASFPAGEFSAPPEEALRAEVARERHGHCNIHHRGTFLRADVYLAGTDPLQAWGLEQRRRLRVGEVEAWVASPEYVILRKLLFRRDGASDRHLRDIAWMLRVSEKLIDLPLLEAKVREQGVEREWADAQRTPLDA